jgi:hypothetical protein
LKSSSQKSIKLLDQEIVKARASGDQEHTQDCYDGQNNRVAMVTEMTYAQGDSASVTPPCSSSTGRTTAFLQDLGAAQTFLDKTCPKIENMVDELTNAQPNWASELEPYPYQQQ